MCSKPPNKFFFGSPPYIIDVDKLSVKPGSLLGKQGENATKAGLFLAACDVIVGSLMRADTPFDFMADIAQPLPIAVAGEWLGLDAESSRLLRDHSPAKIRMLGALADADEIEAGAAAFTTLVTELLPLAADRRSHPDDDLLSLIASDPDLLLDDVVTTAILIAVAGHETTANLLGAAMALST